MLTQQPIFLHEEIMLLALRDKKGTVEVGSNCHYALGGAILAELLLGERVRIEEPKKNKKIVTLASATRFGNPVIDECLTKVHDARRRGSPKTWVQRFSGVKKLKHRVAEGLCRKGVLRADEDRMLLLFTRKIYPEVDPRPEREFTERLRKAIFTDSKEIDPRTIVLVSLASSADLLKMAFTKKELRGRKARIKQIVNGEVTGKATKEVIEAMEAAVIVACIIPAIVAAD